MPYFPPLLFISLVKHKIKSTKKYSVQKSKRVTTRYLVSHSLSHIFKIWNFKGTDPSWYDVKRSLISSYGFFYSFWWFWSDLLMISRDAASSNWPLLEEYKWKRSYFGDRNFVLIMTWHITNRRIQFQDKIQACNWLLELSGILSRAFYGQLLGAFQVLWSTNEMGRWWSFSKISFTITPLVLKICTSSKN